ncbi:MAG: hypothetical protein K2X77_10895 [Candidatus Obscuribacterales bacterium]|nr:hypothetical protein [Candidatus Obscuribacterales bacterium]
MSETDNRCVEDSRFNTAFKIAIREQHQDLVLASRLSPEREAELFSLCNDPDFINRQIAATKKDQLRRAMNVIDLVSDDLYIAQNKWTETPEQLGKLAGRLEANAGWHAEHGMPGPALMDFRRELRIVKSCLGEDSNEAQSISRIINSLENPQQRYYVMPPWRLPVK